MKIFAIKDEEGAKEKALGYLFCCEKENCFYIELPEDADPWETPLLLSTFAKKGERTVNAYWSRVWVQQRIVPPDRQNLGQILRDNGLETYDECALLTIAEGRCAQDRCYIEPVSEDELPQEYQQRFLYKVEDVAPLSGGEVLVSFRDGSVKKCMVPALVGEDREFAPILKDEALFRTVSVQAGGYGICWGENLCIADKRLYDCTGAERLVPKQVNRNL